MTSHSNERADADTGGIDLADILRRNKQAVVKARVAERATGMFRHHQQQLVARIKRSSKYSHQSSYGVWFAVMFVDDAGYPIRGNLNAYGLADVYLGVIVSGMIVELATGNRINADVAGLGLPYAKDEDS